MNVTKRKRQPRPLTDQALLRSAASAAHRAAKQAEHTKRIQEQPRSYH